MKTGGINRRKWNNSGIKDKEEDGIGRREKEMKVMKVEMDTL